MKIRLKDYEILKETIISTIDKAMVKSGKTFKAIHQEYKNANLSDMRFRWDVLHSSKLNISPLYSYLNDNHIDSALKKIFLEEYGI